MPFLNFLGLDNKNANTFETLVYLVIFLLYIIICPLYLEVAFDEIFEKDIIIEHLDQDVFMLQINQKKYYIAYTEIKKLKLTVKRGEGKYKGFIRGRLLLKTKYKSFVFTTNEHIEGLEGLRHHIECDSKHVAVNHPNKK